MMSDPKKEKNGQWPDADGIGFHLIYFLQQSDWA